MAKLSADEEKTLAALLGKKKAPDASPVGKSLNISVDLGDEKQVERAQRLGLLDMFTGADDDDDADGADGADDDDDDADRSPRRRGFFGTDGE